MPAATAPPRKGHRPRNDCASIRRAIAEVAARMHPVYLAPASAPARMPTKNADIIRRSAPNRATARMPIVVKKAIHMSGAPAAKICQNTTGVRRKDSAESHAHSRDTHLLARHAAAAAESTPPKKINPSANFSQPSARPVRIRRCPCPIKKL